MTIKRRFDHYYYVDRTDNFEPVLNPKKTYRNMSIKELFALDENVVEERDTVSQLVVDQIKHSGIPYYGGF